MCSPCSEIRSLTLLAWDTFVTMGEVACVGPIVGDIAVALISHSHQHTAQVWTACCSSHLTQPPTHGSGMDSLL